MGFSPKFLLKSSFRNNTNNNNSSRRSPVLPSTSNGSVLSSSTPINIGQATPPIYMSTMTSSYTSVRSPSNASSSSETSRIRTASEILTIIAEQKICVVRKYGAQEETLVKN